MNIIKQITNKEVRAALDDINEKFGKEDVFGFKEKVVKGLLGALITDEKHTIYYSQKKLDEAFKLNFEEYDQLDNRIAQAKLLIEIRDLITEADEQMKEAYIQLCGEYEGLELIQAVLEALYDLEIEYTVVINDRIARIKKLFREMELYYAVSAFKNLYYKNGFEIKRNRLLGLIVRTQSNPNGYVAVKYKLIAKRGGKHPIDFYNTKDYKGLFVDL